MRCYRRRQNRWPYFTCTVAKVRGRRRLPVRQNGRFDGRRYTYHGVRPFTFTNPNTGPGGHPRTNRYRRRTSRPRPSQRDTVRVLSTGRHRRTRNTSHGHTLPQCTPTGGRRVNCTYRPFAGYHMSAKGVQRYVNGNNTRRSSFSLLPTTTPLFRTTIYILTQSIKPTTPV